MHLRLGLLFLATSLLSAQSPDFASTPDGSALYFSTERTQPGLGQRPLSKIFRVSSAGLELIVEIPPAPPDNTDPWRPNRAAYQPVLNNYGWLAGWSEVGPCVYLSNGPLCYYQIENAVTSFYERQTLINTLRYLFELPRFSPSRRFALVTTYQGLGRFLRVAASLDEPRQIGPVIDTFTFYNPQINDYGEVYYFDGSRSVRVVSTRWPVPISPALFISSPVASSILPSSQEYLLAGWSDSDQLLRLSAFRFDGVVLRSRPILELPRRRATGLFATASGDLFFSFTDGFAFYNEQNPAWREIPLPLPIADLGFWTAALGFWTAAPAGDALWLIAKDFRIFRYRPSTAQWETLLPSGALL